MEHFDMTYGSKKGGHAKASTRHSVRNLIRVIGDIQRDRRRIKNYLAENNTPSAMKK